MQRSTDNEMCGSMLERSLPKFELEVEDLWIQRERALLNISVHEKLMLELVTKSSYVENCS